MSLSNCASVRLAAVTQLSFECSLRRTLRELGRSSPRRRDAIGLQMRSSYAAVFELGQPSSLRHDAIGLQIRTSEDVAYKLGHSTCLSEQFSLDVNM